MSGQKLAVGVVVMGLFVPLILGYFLGLHSVGQFFTVAGTCIIGWAISDLTGTILARPRLKNRSPTDAIRDWERHEGSSAPDSKG